MARKSRKRTSRRRVSRRRVSRRRVSRRSRRRLQFKMEETFTDPWMVKWDKLYPPGTFSGNKEHSFDLLRYMSRMGISSRWRPGIPPITDNSVERYFQCRNKGRKSCKKDRFCKYLNPLPLKSKGKGKGKGKCIPNISDKDLLKEQKLGRIHTFHHQRLPHNLSIVRSIMDEESLPTKNTLLTLAKKFGDVTSKNWKHWATMSMVCGEHTGWQIRGEVALPQPERADGSETPLVYAIPTSVPGQVILMDLGGRRYYPGPNHKKLIEFGSNEFYKLMAKQMERGQVLSDLLPHEMWDEVATHLGTHLPEFGDYYDPDDLYN